MSKLKLYKPTTASRRHSSVVDYKQILTASEPFKPLTTRKLNKAGRNKQGKITVRHRGGGSVRLYRKISFKHNFELGYKVVSIEYDPNRSAFIALVVDLKTGKKHYILHTKGLEVGNEYSTNKEIKSATQVELRSVPIGTMVCQVELQPGKGVELVRSAGSYAEVTAKENGYISLKLPSGEIRKFLETCRCYIGRVGNESHELERIGKAGRTRNMGFRPTVRGKVMNPVDHPHGGGEARNSIGMKYPKTPWGKHALGVKTRNKKKSSSRLIVKRRK